jgi:hypothetical protein
MPLLAAALLLSFAGGTPEISSQRGKVATWKPSSIGSGIRVDFPVPPERQTVEDEDLGIKVDAWQAVHQGKILFSAVHQVIPSRLTGPPDEWLAESQNSALEGDTLTAQKDILINGWPGLAFRARTAGGGIILGHAVVVKERLVILRVQGPSSSVDAPANRFFTSLRLPSSLGRGSQVTAGPLWQRHSLSASRISAEFPTPPGDILTAEGIKRVATARYGNRVFNVFYDQHPAATPGESMSPGQAIDALKRTNEEAVASFGGQKPQSRLIDTPDGKRWRTTFVNAEGTYFGQSDTFSLHGRTIRLMAVVPLCLAKSPELDRFFSSVKID